VEEASVTIALLGSGLDEAAMAHAPEVAGPLRRALTALSAAVVHASAPGPSYPLP
jgi:chromate reductase, NAD(P)H dehydrogenase (quinone)